MREIARKGIAIIYISHKLDEIERICDRVVVMKSGTTCWQGMIAETSMHDLVEVLGGQVKALRRVAQEDQDLPVAVDIKGLTTAKLRGVTMHVRKGEVIGISGLEGAGQSELIREIFREAGKSRSSDGTRASISGRTCPT